MLWIPAIPSMMTPASLSDCVRFLIAYHRQKYHHFFANPKARIPSETFPLFFGILRPSAAIHPHAYVRGILLKLQATNRNDQDAVVSSIGKVSRGGQNHLKRQGAHGVRIDFLTEKQ